MWDFDHDRLAGERAVTMPNGASGGFEPGDPLCVRRPWLYKHYGIYIGDDRVVQFGGRISDKAGANVVVASLAEFASKGTMKRWGDEWIADADRAGIPTKEESVERALWLVAHHPGRSYNVLGRNCESVANWCAYDMPFSVQFVQGYGTLAAFFSPALALMVLLARDLAPNGPIPRWVLQTYLYCFAARGVVGHVGMYSMHRFIRFVERYPTPTRHSKAADLWSFVGELLEGILRLPKADWRDVVLVAGLGSVLADNDRSAPPARTRPRPA